MKRQRGRNRRNNNNQGNANRSLESNGPDVKVRGTAKQIFDKYETLARDAASSGSRVKAENYRQHAEHYLRIVNAIEAAKPTPTPKPEAEAVKVEDTSANAQSDNKDIEGDSNRSSEKQRTKRRYPPQVKKSSKSDNSNNSDEVVEGLETVEPAKEVVIETSAEEVKPATKSTRRRKAPSRESSKDDAATEAAE